MEDHEIITLFLCRDETAIIETRNKYGSKLRHFSMGIVQDMASAEECENDTYLRAWCSIPPQEPWEYFYPYLAKIIRNLSLNRYRDNSRYRRYAHLVALSKEMEQCIPASLCTANMVDEIILKDAINSFLKQLDVHKRNLFLRRYWYLDTIQVIADRYGLSQSSVKVELFRLRKKLKQHLQKEGYPL